MGARTTASAPFLKLPNEMLFQICEYLATPQALIQHKHAISWSKMDADALPNCNCYADAATGLFALANLTRTCKTLLAPAQSLLYKTIRATWQGPMFRTGQVLIFIDFGKLLRTLDENRAIAYHVQAMELGCGPDEFLVSKQCDYRRNFEGTGLRTSCKDGYFKVLGVKYELLGGNTDLSVVEYLMPWLLVALLHKIAPKMRKADLYRPDRHVPQFDNLGTLDAIESLSTPFEGLEQLSINHPTSFYWLGLYAAAAGLQELVLSGVWELPTDELELPRLRSLKVVNCGINFRHIYTSILRGCSEGRLEHFQYTSKHQWNVFSDHCDACPIHFLMALQPKAARLQTLMLDIAFTLEKQWVGMSEAEVQAERIGPLYIATIEGFPALEELCLHYTAIRQGGDNSIVDLIKHCPSLRFLRLLGVDVNPTHLRRLADEIKSNRFPRLRHVQLILSAAMMERVGFSGTTHCGPTIIEVDY